MKEEHDDHARSANQPLPGFDTNPIDSTTRDKQDRDEPYFKPFEEEHEDSYEESDRDTDYAPAYLEETPLETASDDINEIDEIDEEAAFDALLPEDLESENAALFAEQEAFLQREVGATATSSSISTEAEDDADNAGGFWNAAEASGNSWDDEPDTLPLSESSWDADDDAEDWDTTEDEPAPVESWLTAEPADTQSTSVESERWYSDDSQDEELLESERWPMGLIAIGVVALLLVAGGVYGIMQQRAATQDQITQLQASLATAVSPEEISASRAALQQANEQNVELRNQVASLTSENLRLADTVAGLEAQIAALESAPVQSKPAPAPQPKPAPKPAAPAVSSAAPAATAGWFVNFGSYGEEAVAQDWATRLQPKYGNVIVAPSTKDGRTYYRVRVVGLASRDAAENSARSLEAAYQLPRLWVGRQQ